MSLQAKVDGLWLGTIGRPGDLTFSTIAPGASERASWRMALPETFSHPALQPGAPVEFLCGPLPVFAGTLSQPEHTEDGWSFSAAGAMADGDGYLCFDSGGNTTSIPDTAIDEAIADGLNWTRPASISAAAFAAGGSTDALNKVSELLDAWSLSESKRWGVDARRRVFAAADPTTPTLYMKPGSGRLALADDEYASVISVRYKTGPGTYATVHVSDPVATAKYRRAYPYDATHLGVITAGKATDVGNGLLARGKARYALTEPFTVSRHQLTTPGGQPVYLPFVRGGVMVRALGIRDEQGFPLPYYDFVLGRTEYTEGADTIQLSPVNLAARNLGDVLAMAVQA